MTMAHANTALPELGAIEVRGFTRGAFIVRGAFAAGAVYGAGTVGPFVSQALAQGSDSSGDVNILNFALTLEYLEAEFYRRALELDLSPDVRALAATLGTHERDHVAALRETIDAADGTATEKPKVSFPIKDERSFLELAQTLEETGLSAYNGAATSIESREVLAAAGQIAQIEARHAADIRIARGVTPAPKVFDDSLQMEQVLEAVQPFLKS